MKLIKEILLFDEYNEEGSENLFSRKLNANSFLLKEFFCIVYRSRDVSQKLELGLRSALICEQHLLEESGLLKDDLG